MQNCIIYPFKCDVPVLSCFNRIFNELPFTVGVTHNKRISESHWHDYLQIWYTVSGEYRHTLNGTTYTQNPGDAILVFPYMLHQIDTSASNFPETKLVCISIKKDELMRRCIPFFSHTFCDASFDLFRLPPIVSLRGKEKAIADNLFNDILEEYNKKMAMHFNKIFSFIARFFELCISNSTNSVSKLELASMRARFECIDNSMEFLLSNVSEPVTTRDLSRCAMMSERSFLTAFSTTIGQTPHNYILHLRMRYAVDLLRKTNMSIAEIAEKSVFYDSSHFNKKCKELCGMSPLAYRRYLSKWTREVGDDLYKNTIKNSSWVLTFDDDGAERHWYSMSFY
ncbi:MAG: AraC family transcriptional regulator [Oscillospiraceae bacterium]|nr:AraC family transcriptional regulator [Oscillospiraceae bacterium]